VLLAEDHEMVREGLRRLINEQPDFEIVAEAADGADAVRLCSETHPALALVDLSMPTLDGLEAIAVLHHACPEVRLIALTRHDDQSFIIKALTSGAAGYVLKQSASTELLAAMRAVAIGHRYLDQAIGTPPPAAPATTSSLAVPSAVMPLSDGEEQVLRLVATGRSNTEIGARLSLAADSVRTIRSAAMRKLGLTTRVDVIRYAAHQLWLSAEAPPAATRSIATER
jgi:two-component system, NarL family, response regulator NreC